MLEIRTYRGIVEDCPAWEIRRKVFMIEQNVGYDRDETDAYAVHVVVFWDGEPVGTGRTFPVEPGRDYYMGRICVLKEYRKHHLGSEIVGALEEYAAQNGAEWMHLSAQCHAMGFYEKLGYHSYGERFEEAKIAHIHMKKDLRSHC